MCGGCVVDKKWYGSVSVFLFFSGVNNKNKNMLNPPKKVRKLGLERSPERFSKTTQFVEQIKGLKGLEQIKGQEKKTR